ncbi:hypothetical protein FA10DRAFT_295764 [Acaromyces ingoldii]|uniref:Uncharacterized protein n=1 Tax=Acaromyces ingoldii TaxID=215250 RepID=A0A316YF71_9BASI|nr:hypothetical protein FA10DRAFT_295764 [Acaromyces ingoldii]PWN88200.1 hypothetical protein FA10DRAFT_295764 [Acaromyces ingoldii]
MQAATPSTSTAPSAGSTAMTSLMLYTHNVARALKPSTDGELAHAIHETLHYALDGDEADWAAGADSRASTTPCGPDQGATAASGSAAAEPGSVRPGFFATGDDERPFISYAWNAKKRQLTLPNPVTVVNPTLMDPCAPDCNTRDSFDVTAKFFFLGEEDDDIGDEAKDIGPRTEWIEEALEKFTLATGLATVDTLIIAFPGKDLDGVDRRRRRPEHTASANGNGVDDRRQKLQRDVSAIAKVWQQLSPNPRILSMGLSDLSLEALNLLFQSFNPAPPPAPETASASSAFSTPKSAMSTIPIPSSPSSPSVSSNQQRTELGDGAFQAYRLPSPTRRPRIHTINLKEHGGCTDGRCIDRELAEWCKAQGILLVAHNDQRDILPARTLPNLMAEFKGKFPHCGSQPLSTPRLAPRWCFKYTVLIRDRGVLADKGCVSPAFSCPHTCSHLHRSCLLPQLHPLLGRHCRCPPTTIDENKGGLPLRKRSRSEHIHKHTQ